MAQASHQPIAVLLALAGAVHCTNPPASPAVAVPAGDFTMGCDVATDGSCSLSYTQDEGPARRVSVGAFEIDTFEVTIGDYLECVRAGACTYFSPVEDSCGVTVNGLQPQPANGQSKTPVRCVTSAQSADYCRWTGRRLPTEVEWERAARGTDGAIFPWGNDPPDCARAMFSGSGCVPDGPADIGEHLQGVSPVGAQDMSGNVAEWTADSFADSAPEVHVIRGGSWRDGPAADAGMPKSSFLPLRASFRDSLIAVDQGTARSDWVGFRCAQSR